MYLPAAVVSVDDKNVNLELVKAGLAEVYQGKHPRGFDIEPYKKAESEAKKEMKGIWSPILRSRRSYMP